MKAERQLTLLCYTQIRMLLISGDQNGNVQHVTDQNLDVWKTPACVTDALRHYYYQYLSSTSEAAEKPNTKVYFMGKHSVVRSPASSLNSCGSRKLDFLLENSRLRALAHFHQERVEKWNGTELTWEIAEVTMQPGSTECALCVMRNMDLVISQDIRRVDKRLDKPSRYKREHLVPVKEDWSKFFVSNVLQSS